MLSKDFDSFYRSFIVEVLSHTLYIFFLKSEKNILDLDHTLKKIQVFLKKLRKYSITTNEFIQYPLSSYPLFLKSFFIHNNLKSQYVFEI